MELKSYHKVLIASAISIVLGSLVFIAYKQYEITERQSAIEESITKQKQFADSLVRGEDSYASAEQLQTFAKESKLNLKEIQSDLSKLRAEVKSVNVVTVRSTEQFATNVSSTSIGESNPIPEQLPKCQDGTICPDPFGYMSHEQLLNLNEQFGSSQVPIGQVGFKAFDKAPWSLHILPREYKVGNVVGQDEDGRNFVYNKFTVNVNGKDYDLKITKSETKTLYPKSNFYWFNPHLLASFGSGININRVDGQLAPGINFGFLTYGKKKDIPTFFFAAVGFGYTLPQRQTQVSVSPIVYNVGEHLTFLKNTYVGPSVGMNFKGEFNTMLNLYVGL